MIVSAGSHLPNLHGCGYGCPECIRVEHRFDPTSCGCLFGDYYYRGDACECSHSTATGNIIVPVVPGSWKFVRCSLVSFLSPLTSPRHPPPCPSNKFSPVLSQRTFLTTSSSSNYRAHANQEQLVRLTIPGYCHLKLTPCFRAVFQLYIEMQSTQSLSALDRARVLSQYTRFSLAEWRRGRIGLAWVGGSESHPIPSSLLINTSGCPTPRSTRGA